MKNLYQSTKKFLSDNNIATSIVKNLNKKDRHICISLSFLVLGVFLLIIGYYTDSKELQLSRRNIGSVCLALWFVAFPLMDYEKKSDLLIELAKFCLILFVAAVDIHYWSITLNGEYSITSVISDIIFSIIFLFVIIFLIKRVYVMINYLINILQRITNKIFISSNTNKSGFKYIFQVITAALISISATLATLLAIASSLKELVTTFI